MQNQFAVWIAIMFGFTSCTETPDEQFASDLVGTWMEVRTTYAEGDSEEPISIHRKTVILEKVNDRLRFRNCLDDTHATATVEDEKVTLSGDEYPVLELSDDDTLTAVETTDDTEVALYRVSTETNTVMADLSLTQPQSMNTWTQLCLDSVVAEDDVNMLSFKAVNSLLGLTVGMTFTFDAPIVQGQYEYSDAIDTHTATGVYEFPGDLNSTVAGTLSSPDGTMSVAVVEDFPWEFTAELTMDSAGDDGSTGEIVINAILNVEPEWFAPE